MKGRKIEKYILHTFGVEIDIRLNKDLIFFAEIGNELFQSKNADDLKDQIYKKVEALHDAEWKPIIKITYKGNVDHPQEASFELDYEKFYYAIMGEAVKTISWAAYENCNGDKKTILYKSQNAYQKIKDKIKSQSCTYHRDRNGERVVESLSTEYGTFYKPYSEELWQGLESLRESINLANYKISQLISTEKGLAMLMSQGKLMIEFQD